MTTDYIVFVHGVNVRESPENEQNKTYRYADRLFELIQASAPHRTLKKVPLYWANVSEAVLRDFRPTIMSAPIWKALWFQKFRTTQLLQFAGDAVLYISRHVGSMAIAQLEEQALSALKDYQPSDRLHLVTHSWGTVILFDLLFSSRWDNPEIPGHESVQKIRQQLFGLPPDEPAGIRLAGIHTMGSPIATFSLITVVGRSGGSSSHDISPKLQSFLRNITEDGKQRLPWRNFIHPGDPVALPLEKVIPDLVENGENYLDIQDRLVLGSGWLELLSTLFKNTFLALINGGNAHDSYWHSPVVAEEIARTIQSSVTTHQRW
jgi:hypothetical protein